MKLDALSSIHFVQVLCVQCYVVYYFHYTLHWQVSYASTSVALSDRIVYPNFFRTVPSDELLAPALATVMKFYGWRQLSILTEEEPQFIMVFIIRDSNAIFLTMFIFRLTASPTSECGPFKCKCISGEISSIQYWKSVGGG